MLTTDHLLLATNVLISAAMSYTIIDLVPYVTLLLVGRPFDEAFVQERSQVCLKLFLVWDTCLLLWLFSQGNVFDALCRVGALGGDLFYALKPGLLFALVRPKS